MSLISHMASQYKLYLTLQIYSISNESQEVMQIRYYNKSLVGNRNLNTASEKGHYSIWLKKL